MNQTKPPKAKNKIHFKPIKTKNDTYLIAEDYKIIT